LPVEEVTRVSRSRRTALITGTVLALAAFLTFTITVANADSGSTPVGGGYARAAHQPGTRAAVTAPTAPAGYPVKGIDISSHDHDGGRSINWANEAANGIRFGYVKALSTDGRFVGRPWAVVNAAGGVSVFVRNRSGGIEINSWTSTWGQFGGWAALGGAGGVVSDPAAVTTADGVMKVFAVGSDGNLYLSGQSSAGSSFGSWVSLGGGGVLAGNPWALVSSGGGASVYIRTTTGAVMGVGAAYEGGGIGGWASIGGGTATVAGDPAVVMTADGVLKVFVVGGDGGLYFAGQSAAGSSFSTWLRISGASGFTGSPWALVNAGGGASAYVRTTTGTVMGVGAAYEGAAIGGWATIGTNPPTLAAGPAALLRSDRSLAVYATAGDGLLWVTNETSPGGFESWHPAP
jgi:hypothetical protein